MYAQYSFKTTRLNTLGRTLYNPCGAENKLRLFPYTALTDWFV